MGMASAASAFVVQTKPNSESYARDFLHRFGHRVYFPMVRATVRHAGKLRETTRPFLPRYLFIWDDGQNISDLKNAPGVSGMVRQGTAYARAGSDVLDQIRSREGPDGFVVLDAPPTPPARVFEQGRSYRYRGHLSAGLSLNAVFQHTVGEDRAFVFIWLFGRVTRSVVSLGDLGYWNDDIDSQH